MIIPEKSKEIFNKIILCNVILKAIHEENTDKKLFQTVDARDLMENIIVHYIKDLTQELVDNGYT